MRGYGYEPLFVTIERDDHLDAHRRFAARSTTRSTHRAIQQARARRRRRAPRGR
jgi:phosphoketolase